MGLFCLVSAVMVAAWCAAVGLAAPTADGKMSIENVLGLTVCPVAVHLDVDPHRVPRTIKMLRCDATKPNQMCSAEMVSNACCRTHHVHHAGHHLPAARVNMSCVEVTDRVFVRYTNAPDPDQLTQIEVSVGCTCLMTKSNPSRTLTNTPLDPPTS